MMKARKNEIKDDDRIENLEVIKRSPHMRRHLKKRHQERPPWTKRDATSGRFV